MARNKLTAEQKTFIVIRLAEYMTVMQVLREFAEEWPDVSLTKQSIEGYDPTKYAGRALAQKWCVLFQARRTAWLADAASEPLAHRRARLSKLARQVDVLDEEIDTLRSAKVRSPRMIAELVEKQSSIVERIAKEVGDVFTNRRKHEGRAIDVLAQVLGIAPADLEGAD